MMILLISIILVAEYFVYKYTVLKITTQLGKDLDENYKLISNIRDNILDNEITNIEEIEDIFDHNNKANMYIFNNGKLFLIPNTEIIEVNDYENDREYNLKVKFEIEK